MSLITSKQQKDLDALNAQIATARTTYMQAYNADRALTGIPVRPGTATTTAWNALVSLRQQRNALLATYRAAGVNI